MRITVICFLCFLSSFSDLNGQEMIRSDFIQTGQHYVIQIEKQLFDKAKIELLRVVECGDTNCLSYDFKLIGDCITALYLYVDTVQYDVMTIPGGTTIVEPLLFRMENIPRIKQREISLYAEFCQTEESPQTPEPPLIVATNPCEPCLADCDSSGLYAFYDQFHHGWFKATTLPLNEVRSGLGWKHKWLASTLSFTSDLQLGLLDFKWLEDFDVNQYYYGAFYSGLTLSAGVQLGAISVGGTSRLSLAYDYENSGIDYTYYRNSVRLGVWRLFAQVIQEHYDIVELYRIRNSDGYYNRKYLQIGYTEEFSARFAFSIGYQAGVSKYDDARYSRKHKPRWLGGFLGAEFCSFPFNLSFFASYEAGDELEYYKQDGILVDPPIDIFEVQVSVSYFLF